MGSLDTPNVTVRAAQSLSGLSKIWSAVYTIRIALVVPYFKDLSFKYKYKTYTKDTLKVLSFK